MAQPFSVRAALCTAAVMVFFGALATGDLPAGMLAFAPVDRTDAPPTLRRSGDADLQSDGGEAAGAQAAAAIDPQAVRYPALPSAAPGAGGFVPAGWQVETEAPGDLNSDGLADLVLILLARGTPPADPAPDREASIGAPRILVIAFARPAGGYELILADRMFLPSMRAPNGLSAGWMLFEDDSVDISDGRLRIIFEYTRASTIFTFRWEDRAMKLIGYDSAGVSGGCFRGLSINFLSNRARFEAGWIDLEEKQSRWRNLQPRPLFALGEIGDGEDFDPYGLQDDSPVTCPTRP